MAEGPEGVQPEEAQLYRLKYVVPLNWRRYIFIFSSLFLSDPEWLLL